LAGGNSAFLTRAGHGIKGTRKRKGRHHNWLCVLLIIGGVEETVKKFISHRGRAYSYTLKNDFKSNLWFVVVEF
jgi:hypothetical protein